MTDHAERRRIARVASLARRLPKGLSPHEREARVLLDHPSLRPDGWEPPVMATPAPRSAPPPDPAPDLPPPPAHEPRPPGGSLLNAQGKPIPYLSGRYKGASCFLLCGGPSLKTMDLTPLRHRNGFLVMGVNNSPCCLEPELLRPDLWTYLDHGNRFTHHLWLDPGILKFAPLHKQGHELRAKVRGKFRPLGLKVGEATNVVYYLRHAEFSVDGFLSGKAITWGTGKSIDGPLGDGRDRNTRSVLLIALRILYELGVAHVYLIGADFHMDHGQGKDQYAWGQRKDANASRGNTAKFRVLDQWFRLLRPRFEAKGFHVGNVTPDSHLSAFPRLDYNEAVARARGLCAEPVDGAGWY